MKLILTNFKCYEKKEFNIPDIGLILICGVSGVGKSSILEAIFFVLYGVGTKLIKFGKTSCKVEIYMDDNLYVCRNKRPNNLTVKVNKTVYEDKGAQSIINEKFGNSYNITGYVSQNNVNTFILMSPIEKLAFLEKFVFNSIDLGDIKKRCKNLIKERNEKLIGITSQLDLANNMLKELENPGKLDFPLTCPRKYKTGEEGREYREKLIKNENIRCKNAETSIKKVTNFLEKVKVELRDIEILKANTKTKKELLSVIDGKLLDLDLEESEIEVETEEKIEEYEKVYKEIIAYKKLLLLKQKCDDDQKIYNELKQTEIIKFTEKINKIKGALWKKYTKEEANEMIEKYKELYADSLKVKKLTKELEDYKIDLEGFKSPKEKIKNKSDLMDKKSEELEKKKGLLSKLKFQKELFTCPSCNDKLRFRNNKLCTVSNVEIEGDNDIEKVKSEIRDLSLEIKKLNSLISRDKNRLNMLQKINKQIEEIGNGYEEDVFDYLFSEKFINETRVDLQTTKEYLISQNNLEKQKKELENKVENEIFSSSLITFGKRVEKQKYEIKNLEKLVPDNFNPENINDEDLKDKIRINEQNKSKLKSIKKRQGALCLEKENYQNEIEDNTEKHILKYKKVRTVKTLQKTQEKTKDKITGLLVDLESHKNNILQIKKYQEWEKSKKNWDMWVDKVKKIKKDENIYRKEYGAATLLKETIVKAESVAMINIIDSINTHAQQFLDEFFTENPISVLLKPFKETKKNKKPQINIVIEYKGMEATIGMLSGGELSRVVLAYTLALGEMFNTPMIMLDEVAASLDQNLTTEVMDTVKTHFSEKLILVVAHQVVKGNFDSVIEL